MDDTPAVLIVEDEAEWAELVSTWLGQRGYRPIVVATGRDGLRAVHQHRPDIVILDVSLPDLDGWDVIERIRDLSQVPVIMLTARSADEEKVRGLRLGADDYVTKPASLLELEARVESALRRSSPASAGRSTVFRVRDLVVNVSAHRVERGGRRIRLTPTEFRLFTCLLERRGETVTHREALTAVWGLAYAQDRHLLRVTVRNLRQKIDGVASEGSIIATEYGIGYRIE